MNGLTPLVLIILTTVVTVVGDVFLKKASGRANSFFSSDFIIGAAVYMVTAFLWVVIYRMAKFSTLGVIYSLVGIIVFVAMGVMVFGERLSWSEAAGVGMAIASVVLLARFL